MFPVFGTMMLYGALLLAIALVAAKARYRQSWRRVAFIVLALLGYMAIPALIRLIVDMPAWLAPFLEEPLKLAIIVTLGARRRLPVAICLAFAGVEVMDKAFLALDWPPFSPMDMAIWLALITGPVLMHCATGLIYSERGTWETPPLLIAAIALHFAHNSIVSSFEGSVVGVELIAFIFALGLGELLLVFALINGLKPHPGATMAPGDGA